MIVYMELGHIMAMHQILIEKYGGSLGVRDQGLLESAIAQPRQEVFGKSLFPSIPAKAAAYAYYLSENQPFVDGNKRIAAASALTFLRLNGFDLQADPMELYKLIMELANKKISKEKLIQYFKAHIQKQKK